MSKLSRRQVLAAGASSIALAVLASRAVGAGLIRSGGQQMPNILCFVSEDNYPLIGAYGDHLAHTPTLDAMAKDGVLFEHAYCTSPVCGPSRFALITGMYQESAGSAEDFGSTDESLTRQIRGLPAHLRDAGYYCINHEKKNYNSQFDFIKLWDESGRDAHWRNRPGQAPFFAIFNTFTTHESALFQRQPRVDTVKPEQVQVPPYLPDTPGVRRDFARFYNAMEQMDGEFARCLKEVEDAGLMDDTIVIYYSDNGGITPRSKRFCYDMGSRCALMMRFPKRWQHLSAYAPGSRVKDAVSFVDIPATILSLAAQPVPQYMHGKPLLGTHATQPAPYAFTSRDRMDERYDLTRSVTDGRYRYIRNYAPHRPWGQHVAFMFQAEGYRDWEVAHRQGKLNGVQDRFWGTKPFEELYDTDADPHQVTNLAGQAAHRGTLQRLGKALDEHMTKVNDTGFIPEGLPLKDYKMSRLPGAYPLEEIRALANLAASNPGGHFERLLAALAHDHEVMRYWAAVGFLIAGAAAEPYASQLRNAFDREKTVPVRIPLAECLAVISDDKEAIYSLGELLDQEDDGPYRLQAINALTYIGQRAEYVLPAVRRSCQEDHRHVRSAALYLVALLEGKYEPSVPNQKKPGGYVPITPTVDGSFPAGRPYD